MGRSRIIHAAAGSLIVPAALLVLPLPLRSRVTSALGEQTSHCGLIRGTDAGRGPNLDPSSSSSGIVSESAEEIHRIDEECYRRCRETCGCDDLVGTAKGSCLRQCNEDCRNACARPDAPATPPTPPPCAPCLTDPCEDVQVYPDEGRNESGAVGYVSKEHYCHPDQTQYVFVEVRAEPSYVVLSIGARDSAGKVAACVSDSPNIVAAVQTATSHSKIAFLEHGGSCDFVSVTTGGR